MGMDTVRPFLLAQFATSDAWAERAVAVSGTCTADAAAVKSSAWVIRGAVRG